MVTTRIDQKKLWSPYFDMIAQRVVVLGGRLAFDQDEWRKINELSGDGDNGIICRYISELWSTHGAAIVDHLNGAFALLIWQLDDEKLTVITDRLGAFPVFATTAGKLHIATHPDVLKRASGLPLSLDFTTMAEVLAFGGSVHPYSYYHGIVQLDPASVYDFRLSPRSETHYSYWSPEYNPQKNLDLLADQIAQAIRNAVHRRTKFIDGNPGLFLSGGVDSRSILFSLPNPETSTAITFYEQTAGEPEVAELLAQRAKVNHISLVRDRDYYFKGAQEAMQIMGGMWNIVDAHFLGYIRELAEYKFSTLLTGCYADYMFKGLLQNRVPLRILGLNTGLEKLGPFQLWYYLWRHPIADKWLAPVFERLREPLSGLTIPPRSDADRLKLEARRLIPLAREGDWLFRGLAWRTLPFDHLFSDREIIDAYLAVPIKFKLNGLAFREAVSRICRNAHDIPDSNRNLAVNAPRVAVAFHHMKKSYLHGLSDTMPPAAADFKALLTESGELCRLWDAHTVEESEILSDLLGYDPFRIEPASWGEKNRSDQFYRIFSLSLWLRGILGDARGAFD